jgi:molybdopterin-guanine dinucleotide biosynthesis protein A
VYDAIVLAGGRARRLGGVDKAGVLIGSRSLLQRVLDAVADAQLVVVAGPERPGLVAAGELRWCQEDPPGGGPLAAMAAAVPSTSADRVVVLAADLPWIAPAIPVLLAGCVGHDAAVLTDGDGRANIAAAAWRRTALLAALTAVGPPAGAALRLLYRSADVAEIDDAGWGQDCDSWDDIDRAQARAEKGATP